MTALVFDERLTDRLVAERRRLGQDRHDEVWDGVYVMSPAPTNDHQDVVTGLATICKRVGGRIARVQAGANVSDRQKDWEHSYRVPDVVVVLPGCPAIDHETHWQGGPDFLIEVRSPGDNSLDKLTFYAAIGVREVLVVERDSREPALFRLARKKLTRVKPTDLAGEPWLVSEVLPLAFSRVEPKAGPRLAVRRTAGAARTWRV